MSSYSKFIVALGAALTVAAAAVQDGAVNATEWIQIAAAFIGALGVYTVSNAPKPGGAE